MTLWQSSRVELTQKCGKCEMYKKELDVLGKTRKIDNVTWIRLVRSIIARKRSLSLEGDTTSAKRCDVICGA